MKQPPVQEPQQEETQPNTGAIPKTKQTKQRGQKNKDQQEQEPPRRNPTRNRKAPDKYGFD